MKQIIQFPLIPLHQCCTVHRHEGDALTVLVFIDTDQAECFGQSTDGLVKIDFYRWGIKQCTDLGLHIYDSTASTACLW